MLWVNHVALVDPGAPLYNVLPDYNSHADSTDDKHFLPICSDRRRHQNDHHLGEDALSHADEALVDPGAAYYNLPDHNGLSDNRYDTHLHSSSSNLGRHQNDHHLEEDPYTHEA